MPGRASAYSLSVETFMSDGCVVMPDMLGMACESLRWAEQDLWLLNAEVWRRRQTPSRGIMRTVCATSAYGIHCTALPMPMELTGQSTYCTPTGQSSGLTHNRSLRQPGRVSRDR
jgi:hypothetical protein